MSSAKIKTIKAQKKRRDNINENYKKQWKADINAEWLQMVQLPEIFFKVNFCVQGGKKRPKTQKL